MNEKLQAILLKLIVELKKLHWRVDKNWELTLKSEGHVPLVKYVSVHGSLDEDEWDEDLQTTIDVRLESDDQVTYFPEFTVYVSISIEGADATRDVAHKTDNDTAFTDRDVSEDAKIKSAAQGITRSTENLVEHEYDEYIQEHGNDITYHKKLGVDPDQYDDVD